MRVCTLILVVSSYFSNVHAQGDVLTIVDATTGLGIAGASITVGDSIFYTDEYGQIRKDILENYTSTVIAADYKPEVISQLPAHLDTLSMIPDLYQLPEVVITNSNPPVEVGYHSYEELNPRVIISGGIEGYYGVIIEPMANNYTIDEVIINFSKMHRGYSFDLYFILPSTDLSERKILASKKVSVSNGRRKVRVDVSQLSLRLPKTGIFVAVALPSDENSNGKDSDFIGLTLTKEVSADLSFMLLDNTLVPANKMFEYDQRKKAGEHWNFRIGALLRQVN